MTKDIRISFIAHWGEKYLSTNKYNQRDGVAVEGNLLPLFAIYCN
jgi:hypothetical protein